MANGTALATAAGFLLICSSASADTVVDTVYDDWYSATSRDYFNETITFLISTVSDADGDVTIGCRQGSRLTFMFSTGERFNNSHFMQIRVDENPIATFGGRYQELIYFPSLYGGQDSGDAERYREYRRQLLTEMKSGQVLRFRIWMGQETWSIGSARLKGFADAHEWLRSKCGFSD